MKKFSGIVVLLVALVAPWASSWSTQPATIIDLKVGCVTGGFANGQWLKADLMAARLKGGESYLIYTLNGYVGKALGSAPESPGPPCEDAFSVDVDRRPSGGAHMVGIAGDWNAARRPVRITSVTQDVYHKAVADFLIHRGLRSPKINLTQVLRVDLDGDGVEEVLISATSYVEFGPHAKRGDYSVVLLRRVVQGHVETIPIITDIHRDDAEFNLPCRFSVAAALDGNGDSKLEVFVYGEYYEGHWTSVYQVDGTTVTEVLSCGCGA